MYGLTHLGAIHTAISLVAVAAGVLSFVRHGEIAWRLPAGRAYVLLTVLTCLTGFPIFQHGGFGKPHALGILTLLVLALALLSERRGLFGTKGSVVSLLAYSLSFFFHMVPAFTETATRLPLGAPLAASPEDPGLQAAIGFVFLLFLAGAWLQLRRLRDGRLGRKDPIRELHESA